MNIAVIERWVEALESGEYAQTKGVLRRNEDSPYGHKVGYCCLGVLCDLAVREGVITETKDKHSSIFGDDAHKADLELPVAVVKWAGLLYSSPEIEVQLDEDDCDSAGECYDEDPKDIPLASLNDDYGWDFKKIAAGIRSNWL
jgi:hypothetical protein